MDVLSLIKKGNSKQRKAFKAIKKLHIMELLSNYTPLLCGTIPLGIDHEKSDLDIVLESKDLYKLQLELNNFLGTLKGFTQQKLIIRNQNVLITNFYYSGFEFELFAQDQPTKDQYAYMHMIIEYYILQDKPRWKKQIQQMKRKGMKTESGFCKLLGLQGDPYEKLIAYGKNREYI